MDKFYDCAMYIVTNKITRNPLTVFHHINNNLTSSTKDNVIAEIVRCKDNECYVIHEKLKQPNKLVKFKNKLLYKVDIYLGNYEQWFS